MVLPKDTGCWSPLHPQGMVGRIRKEGTGFPKHCLGAGLGKVEGGREGGRGEASPQDLLQPADPRFHWVPASRAARSRGVLKIHLHL